jgi:hypothetical protein
MDQLSALEAPGHDEVCVSRGRPFSFAPTLSAPARAGRNGFNPNGARGLAGGADAFVAPRTQRQIDAAHNGRTMTECLNTWPELKVDRRAVTGVECALMEVYPR